MSILIKGLTMPRYCAECLFCKRSYDEALNYVDFICIVDGKILSYCPLIPIHDHGDLIDRDALKKDLIDEGETVGVDGFSVDGLSADDVCYAIENAPIVIPAERSEE